MHSARFSIRLRSCPDAGEIANRLACAPYIATTRKFDSNRIFELGRRYGFQGRIFSHAIVVANDLLMDGRVVRGWAFVPQEGNSILSTLEAFLRQSRHPHADEVAETLRRDLLRSEW
jgi:glyceraldehyde-3-phosphate dehydrogenase (NAD(P))